MADPRMMAIEGSPLNPILGEIEHAISQRMYWSAITLCLTLPDICAAAESLDGTENFFKSKPRYLQWAKTWLSNSFVHLTPDDIWALRGGLVHRGQTFGHPNARYRRVIFAVPGANTFADCVVDREGIDPTYTISVTVFCHEMMKAVLEWNLVTRGDERIQTALDGLIRYRPNGFEDDIIGVPVIA